MTSFIRGNGEEPIERDRMTIEYGDDNEALIFDGGDPDRIILDENGYAKTAFLVLTATIYSIIQMVR